MILNHISNAGHIHCCTFFMLKYQKLLLSSLFQYQCDHFRVSKYLSCVRYVCLMEKNYSSCHVIFIFADIFLLQDSLLKPVTRILVGVVLITIMITLVSRDTPEWIKKLNISGVNFPPWILACVVIVFTRMRKRTKDFLKKYGWWMDGVDAFMVGYHAFLLMLSGFVWSDSNDIFLAMHYIIFNGIGLIICNVAYRMILLNWQYTCVSVYYFSFSLLFFMLKSISD